MSPWPQCAGAYSGTKAACCALGGCKGDGCDANGMVTGSTATPPARCWQNKNTEPLISPGQETSINLAVPANGWGGCGILGSGCCRTINLQGDRWDDVCYECPGTYRVSPYSGERVINTCTQETSLIERQTEKGYDVVVLLVSFHHIDTRCLPTCLPFCPLACSPPSSARLAALPRRPLIPASATLQLQVQRQVQRVMTSLAGPPKTRRWPLRAHPRPRQVGHAHAK